jgi:hypothetical protein
MPHALSGTETQPGSAQGAMNALKWTPAKFLDQNEKNPMKMLFFSSDWTEVELVRNEFIEAKIPCEVRITGPARNMPANAIDAQLWIRNEQDSYRALLLCVERGIGFGKPAPSREALAA